MSVFNQLRAGSRIRAEWIVIVFLTVIGFTFFSLLRPGNTLGVDEWAVFYRALQGGADYTSKPLPLILITLSAPLFHANPIPYYILYVVMWIIEAFLVYVIVRMLSPDRPLFAVACAVLYIVYFQDDFFMVLMFFQTGDVLTSGLVTLAALASHIAYMKSESMTSRRVMLLIVSLFFAGIGPLVREATIPMLFGMPIILFILHRKFDRSRWLGVGAICGVVLLVSLRYILPVLGLTEATYGSGMVEDFNLIRMTNASLVQFKRVVAPVTFERATFRPVLAMIGIMAVLLGAGSFLMHRLFPDQSSKSLQQRLREHIVWIIGSLMAIWLGFAAYLPTLYAEAEWRTHMLSKPAEAILLASLVWLVGDLVGQFVAARGRLLVQYLGVLYIAITGIAMLARVQSDLDLYEGTWQDTGRFMHSLAEQVPAVKTNTLFIYDQVPDPYETPFTSGWGFQYAMRYFYEDRVTGTVTIDGIFGTEEVSDQGIRITEQWIEGEHLYEWDEIIVIARDANKNVYIVDRLPDKYYTPDRQQQYDPFSCIIEGEIPSRIIEAFGTSP
jgi:hypothetical protein